MKDDPYAPYEARLREFGMDRTRDNYLWVLYGGDVPEELDAEDEMSLPPDLRAITD